MTESLRLAPELERLGGITDDVSLADALYAILEKERAKDADEADGEIIFEAADMLAYLGGESAAESADAIARVRAAVAEKTAEETKTREKRGIRWKLIIPIAAAFVALASLAAVTLAGGRRVADLTNDQWKAIEPGAVVTDGELEIRKPLSSCDYDDFAEMAAAENLPDLLCPTSLDAELILVTRYGNGVEIDADLVDESGAPFIFQIDTTAKDAKLGGATEKIGGLDVKLTECGGAWQAEWIADGAAYLMQTADRGALVSAIESLAPAE